jgi:chromosome segregation ATPase
MGRTAIITFEQISAAADALKAEGLKITSRAVRERLGNSGSMGTVNQLLQRWKAGQERPASGALALPPAIQRALLDFIDAELAGARAPIEADLGAQQQEAADLALENELLAAQNDDHLSAIDALRADAAAQQGRAGQLDADLQDARGEAARERSAAETARTELAKAQLRLEAMPRLEADLGTVRGAMEAERQGKIAAEQAAAVLTAKHEAAERRAAEADARTANADRAMARLAEKLETMAAALLDASKATQTAQARLEIQTRNAEDAKAAAGAQREAALRDAGLARAEAKTAHAQSEALGATVKDLRAQLAAAQPEPEPAAPAVKRKS